MSNRLTFSLASLIFLIVLGLAFAPAYVMAHDPVSNGGNPPADSHNHPDGLTQGDHEHPQVTVTITDSNPNVAGIQIVDTDADPETTGSQTPTIQFDIKLEFPDGAQSGNITVTTDAFNEEDELALVTVGPNNSPVGSLGTLNWTAVTGATAWTTTATITLPNVQQGTSDKATDDARDAAKLAAIEAGLSVKLTLYEDMFQTTGLSDGPMENQRSLRQVTRGTFIAEAVDKVPDAVEFAVTGTPSLTDAFTVTFTSMTRDDDDELVGAKIEETNINLGTPATSSLRYNSLSSNKDDTVWTVVIEPNPGATEVSVGLTTNATSGATAYPSIAMISTKGPAAPTGFAAVADGKMVTFTWNASSGATGYIITQSGQAAMTYPVAGTKTTFTTSTLADGNYKFAIAATNAKGTGPATKAVSVKIPGVASPTGKTPLIVIPTQYDSSGPIALGSQFQNTMIPAHGWAVLVRDVDGSKTYSPQPQGTQGSKWIRSVSTSLPDLALFFGGRNGINSGTVSLHAPDNKRKADDIVISEIMWGVDTSMKDDPACSQWIEFYNTTTQAIDLTGWTINFHRSLVHSDKWKTPTLVDIASNAGVTDEFPVHKYHAPWAPKGQSGVYNYAAAAVNNIISMYLEINYTQDPTKKHTAPSGADAGAWSASVYPQSNLPFGVVGTPGAATVIRLVYAETPISRALIINEIGNSANDAHDWVEIYNPGDAAASIKDMRLTTVWDGRTATDTGPVGKEEILFTFPDRAIPAKSYVVFAASDPKNPGNDLAAGIDITKADRDQPNKGLGSHAGKDGILGNADDNTTAFYQIHSSVNLPNDKVQRLYMLRTNDKIGANPDAQGNVVDVIGSLAIPLRNQTPVNWTQGAPTETGRTDTASAAQRRVFDTLMWPLQWSNKDTAYGKSVPHAKRVNGGDAKKQNIEVGLVYQRNGTGLPNAENHLTTRGYTGVGYDRHAPVNAENGGTPGYANGSVVRDKSDWMGQVTISEIMLPIEEGEGPTRVPRATRLPQWFEIYNNSLTQGVNLDQWYLEIQNTARGEDPSDFKGNLHATLRLPAVNIAPNQTVLVVAASGLHSPNFPQQRVINLYTSGTYRAELGILNRGEPFLNTAGFYIQLRDHKNNHVDEVGNLGLSHRDSRTGIGRRDETQDTWEVPALYDENGHRTSFIRIYNGGKALGGLSKDSWKRAADVNFNRVPNLTYYGNHEDRGTPGYHGGGPLPVSLSKFRPERLKETGEVVIRWITESELNNAGFNILRSDTRNGEYTKLNTQLIAGQGTTSERTTYQWKDTSAKPNVAYYYQIQDVSLDGQVTPLRVNRLKGHVNAAGKATTTWGELKALQ